MGCDCNGRELRLIQRLGRWRSLFKLRGIRRRSKGNKLLLRILPARYHIEADGSSS